MLSELNALRAADGSSANNYGVLKTSYSSGVAGIGYVGSPVSMGWDKLPSGSEVMPGPGGQHFAFVVPLTDARQMRLSALEFRGRGRSVQRRAALPAAALENAAAAAGLVADGPGRARLRWNEAALPMVMVRSAATGEVLSFARGGDQLVETNAADVELVVSDGVRSVVRRARVGGR